MNETTSSRMICSLPGFSTLSDERIARPMKRMKSVINPTKTMWSGTWIPQRREQQVDYRD